MENFDSFESACIFVIPATFLVADKSVVLCSLIYTFYDSLCTSGDLDRITSVI